MRKLAVGLGACVLAGTLAIVGSAPRAAVAAVDDSYSTMVMGTSGLRNYWRLGDAVSPGWIVDEVYPGGGSSWMEGGWGPSGTVVLGTSGAPIAGKTSVAFTDAEGAGLETAVGATDANPSSASVDLWAMVEELPAAGEVAVLADFND